METLTRQELADMRAMKAMNLLKDSLNLPYRPCQKAEDWLIMEDKTVREAWDTCTRPQWMHSILYTIAHDTLWPEAINKVFDTYDYVRVTSAHSTEEDPEIADTVRAVVPTDLFLSALLRAITQEEVGMPNL